MEDIHTLNARSTCKKETGKGNESCPCYRLMAFVVPFMSITIVGLVCQNYSVLVASTLGLLAGATGFGLYSAIKLTLRTARASRSSRLPQVEVIEQW